jgi:hypothetical protein
LANSLYAQAIPDSMASTICEIISTLMLQTIGMGNTKNLRRNRADA